MAVSLKLPAPGAQAPKVALMPDGLFFVRSVAVPPGSQPQEVASQVELALEGMSPFPLAHLFYGYHWVSGSDRALVFATYRRRFTPEQTAAWAGAELVIPAFAALLGAAPEPATTWVLASPEGLTAIHWAQGAVPSQVLFRPVPPGAPDEERARIRSELLRAFESRKIVDLQGPPVALPWHSDRERAFRCGELASTLPTPLCDAADIRDKDDLAGLRKARARGVLTWRILCGCAVAAVLMAIGELGILAGGLWVGTLRAKVHAQAPAVEQISNANTLANRIEDLSTKRLLPMEMVALVGAPSVRPDSIYFVSANSRDRLTLTIEAKTGNASQIQVYHDNLQALPACDKVDFKLQPAQNNLTPFTIVVKFKPGFLKPATSPS